jgi:lysine-specific demethylase 3
VVGHWSALLTIDFCSTTVFGGSWLCLDCGREYCKSCYDLFPAITVERNDGRVILQPRELQRLVRCQFKGPPHGRSSLRAVSRFARAQLEKEWLAMVTTALEVEADLISLLRCDLPFQKLVDALALAEYRPNQVKAKSNTARPYTRATSTLPRPRDPAGLAEQSHLFTRFSSAESLPNELFDELWSLGEPIVVDNCLSGLSYDWSPTGFTNKYGAQRCGMFHSVLAYLRCHGLRDKSNSHQECCLFFLNVWPPAQEDHEAKGVITTTIALTIGLATNK